MECSIRKHDDRQVEVKVAYPLRHDLGRGRHSLELFLFLPYNLGLDAKTYPPERFYEDLRTYTRFKTPEISLRDLADEEKDASPLTRLARMARAARENSPWDAAKALYEIRMLANVVRAEVRRRARVLYRPVPEGEWRHLAEGVDRLCAELGILLDRLRVLGQTLSAPETPPEIHRGARLAHEYILAQAYTWLLRLLRGLVASGGEATEAAPALERLRGTIRGIEAHRSTLAGAPSVSGDELRNEQYLRRESLLKKFCAEVLFLSVEQRSAARPAQHVIFGLAAGLAMAVAVAAAALAGRAFPVNTAAFALAAIVAYVLKDRLKDLVRDYGARVLPRWVCDRKGRLIDPQQGDRIGETRESMRWRPLKDTPREVIEARGERRPDEQDTYLPREEVVHYSKLVSLNHKSIYRRHQRAAAIDDIIRLQVRPWLLRMDNPRKSLLRLTDSGAVESLSAPRVYHVNMIVRVGALDGKERLLRRVRLVLSRKRIERIEHVSADETAAL